jgi:hypothetical protein
MVIVEKKRNRMDFSELPVVNPAKAPGLRCVGSSSL